MMCPKCKEKLRVTHTYQAGERAESRNLKCQCCGYVATSVTFLIERQPRKHGRGAKAMADKIAAGEVLGPDLNGEVV